MLDRLFSSKDERKQAREDAEYAVRVHGEAAPQHIKMKMVQPGRKGSLRTLRLTSAEVTRLLRRGGVTGAVRYDVFASVICGRPDRPAS
jgi:hypothetical protein